MKTKRPEGFYINRKGQLVLPRYCESIHTGLDILEPVPAKAPEDPNLPVIAVPERGVNPWIFQVPELNEVVKAEGEETVLLFFWAEIQESGERRIVVLDDIPEGAEWGGKWHIVTTEEWTRSELGGEMFRIFETADAAKAACPDKILMVPFRDGPWKGIVVHSARIGDEDIFLCTNPVLLAALGMPDGIPFNWEEWARASNGIVYGQLSLKTTIPRWTAALKDGDIGPSVIRMVVTEKAALCVLVRDDDGDNECGVRFFWRSVPYRHAKLLLSKNKE